jgi:hypothetical protein
MSAWEALIQRYCPEGQRVCNCGQAYETFLPAQESGTYKGGVPVAAWRCKYGCQANINTAREIVATAVCSELGKLGAM